MSSSQQKLRKSTSQQITTEPLPFKKKKKKKKLIGGSPRANANTSSAPWLEHPVIHKPLQGKPVQIRLLLTYNIHYARFTGSPSLYVTMETSHKKLECSWA